MENSRKGMIGAPTTESRRKFLIGVAGLAGSTIFPLSPAWSQSSGCNIISRLIVEAQTNVDDPGSWQLSLDPLAVHQAKANVVKLKLEIKKLSGVVADNRRAQLLDYTDAVGGSLLLLSGVFIGLGPALIASVAFAGSMLVVRTVSSPIRINLKDFLLNVGGSRLPSVIEAFGEGAGVISKNAASYGKVAGNITGAVFVAYSFYQFAQSTEKFQASTAKLDHLHDVLAGLEDDLSELEQLNKLLEMRRACAQAVADDLKIIKVANCPIDLG